MITYTFTTPATINNDYFSAEFSAEIIRPSPCAGKGGGERNEGDILQTLKIKNGAGGVRIQLVEITWSVDVPEARICGRLNHPPEAPPRQIYRTEIRNMAQEYWKGVRTLHVRTCLPEGSDAMDYNVMCLIVAHAASREGLSSLSSKEQLRNNMNVVFT